MWFSGRSGSGGEPPTVEQFEQWHRRASPPDNEFGAAVGLSVLLGRTDDAAVGLTQVEAFSTGFRFTLTVRLRQVPPRLAPGGLLMLIDFPGHPGVEVSLEDRLLLGIEYSDGRRASNVHGSRQFPDPSAAEDNERLLMTPQGGGGGDQSADETYWLSPLPPDGPVTVVLAWPGFGIAESRTVLDGTAVRAAASRSQTLWPPQPFTDAPEPPPPPRPSSGWFAEPPD